MYLRKESERERFSERGRKEYECVIRELIYAKKKIKKSARIAGY